MVYRWWRWRWQCCMNRRWCCRIIVRSIWIMSIIICFQLSLLLHYFTKFNFLDTIEKILLFTILREYGLKFLRVGASLLRKASTGWIVCEMLFYSFFSTIYFIKMDEALSGAFDFSCLFCCLIEDMDLRFIRSDVSCVISLSSLKNVSTWFR